MTLAAVLATLLLAAPAVADSRDEARSKLRAGVALMEQGDYAGALAAFEDAYVLVPSPKIQFNIGTAYDALARPAAAHEALSRFLAVPTDAPADTIAKARAMVAVLEKKVGRIAVTSDQADDQIFVDGRPRGTTPLATAVVVDPGTHAVTLKRGEAQFTENVSLAEGEERTVVARFSGVGAAAPVRLTPLAPVVPAAAPPLSSAAVDVTAQTYPSPPATRPVYRRAWFWGAVAGGVVAASVIGVVALSTTEYPRVDKTIDGPMP